MKITNNTTEDQLKAIVDDTLTKEGSSYLLQGDTLQAVGLRKNWHRILNEANAKGLAVNDAMTGNVHLSVDDKHAKKSIDSLVEYLKQKDIAKPEIKEIKDEPLHQVTLNAAKVKAFFKDQGFIRSVGKPLKENQDWIKERFNLSIKGGKLHGYVTDRALKQLHAEEPVYQQQITEPHEFGPNKFSKQGEHIHTHTKTLSDGSKLDIHKLIELVKNKPVERISLNELDAPKKPNKKTGFSLNRYKNTDTKYPLIVDKNNFLLDGRHRYFKLKDQGETHANIVRALEEDLELSKLGQYAYTYVPRTTTKSILRDGLMSGEELLNHPKQLELMAQSRGSTAEDQRSKINKALQSWHPYTVQGPNVLFQTPPDVSKLNPNHPLNKYKLDLIKIHLKQYLQDNPTTKLHGMELIPYNNKDERKSFIDRRHHELSSEEINKYYNTKPEDIWKHYSDEENKGYYAANVPHAAILTPKIDAKYLSKVGHELVFGASGAGKTTRAKQLAEEKKLPIIHLDDHQEWGDWLDKNTKETGEKVKSEHLEEDTPLSKEYKALGRKLVERALNHKNHM